MLENCKRLICSSSLNKVYCIPLHCIADVNAYFLGNYKRVVALIGAPA